MFTDEGIADRRGRINGEEYRATVSAQIQPNAAKVIVQPFSE